MSTERINNSDLEDYLPSEAKGKVIIFSGCREHGKVLKDAGFQIVTNDFIEHIINLSKVVEDSTMNWTKFQHYSNRRTK